MLSIDVRPTSIGFVLLLGYLAFIPIGPFPVYIIPGFRLDVSFGLLLVVFLIPYLAGIKKLPDVIILAWLFYFVIVFLSSVVSVNVELSARNAFVMFGYSIITLLVPIVFLRRVQALRTWLFFSGCIVAALVLYLYLAAGFGRDHRFALSMGDIPIAAARRMGVASVDPNMTAAGLALSLIAYFPELFLNRKRFLFDSIGCLAIILAVLVTLSRSALLGFIVAIVVSFMMVFINSVNLNNVLVLNRKILVSSFVFTVSVIGITFLGYFVFPEILDKLIGRVVRSFEDSTRIALLIGAWDLFMSDIKTMFIGAGFMTTNPHNEYMRTLSTMGLLGMIASASFLASIFYFSIRASSASHRMMFSALSIIVFVLVVSLFYGYTKLIWVAWMFLLLLYKEASAGFCAASKNVSSPETS